MLVGFSCIFFFYLRFLFPSLDPCASFALVVVHLLNPINHTVFLSSFLFLPLSGLLAASSLALFVPGAIAAAASPPAHHLHSGFESTCLTRWRDGLVFRSRMRDLEAIYDTKITILQL
eukprot:m.48387 g.48387  ORF g.48387 m.48387 type:complete len:118 (+) comp6418_c0_seq1:1882-2235(+)